MIASEHYGEATDCRRAIPPGATESHWRTKDGHPVRRLDMKVPSVPRGSLLFLPGRGDAYEKWLESLMHWQTRGWRVTALDWRGQAGSGRLGRDATTGHVDDFAIWIADLARFWDEWQAGMPGPHVIIGHSMGGHLVLRALAEGAVRPDAVVLSAPMLGMLALGLPTWLLLPVARTIARLGDARRPAWKASEKPGAVPEERILLLTHDKARYADEMWWRHARPELAMGPASWGWIAAALASIRKLEMPGVLERVTVPVQILGTRHDGLVAWRAIARAARRLPACELVTFGREARHELLREADPVRNRVLAAIDSFLDRAIARA